MSKGKCVRALGLMSGTSMDGVDAAILEAEIDAAGVPHLRKLGAHHEIPFPAEMRQQITAVLGRETPDDETATLEQALTAHYHHAVETLLQKASLQSCDIDLIGLHGQTITHRPEKAFTWQLGDGTALAEQCTIDVVYDFRQQDIRAGGQGAPLAPVFHQALAQADFIAGLPLLMLNIGGVGNITFIDHHQLRAYDTGPGNGSMDDYCQEFLGLGFDANGDIAATGKVHDTIVQDFACHPYFAQPAPKSLDRRDFTCNAVRDLTAPDALRTLAACSAQSIAMAVRTEQGFAPDIRTLLVTGGGRQNTTLMQEIQSRLPEITLRRLDTAYPQIHGDALEAWAFAWLAVLHQCQQPASFPTTTGVPTPQCAGVFASSRQG